MAQYMQLNDTGVLLQVTVYDAEDSASVYSLAGATSTYILLGPPIGDAIEAVASFTASSGTDGILQYATTSGDIDVEGEWDIQAYWINSSGDERHSTVTQFDVYGNVE